MTWWTNSCKQAIMTTPNILREHTMSWPHRKSCRSHQFPLTYRTLGNAGRAGFAIEKTFATDVHRKIQEHSSLPNFNLQWRVSLLFVVIPYRRSYFRSSVGGLSKIEDFYTTFMAGYGKNVWGLLFVHWISPSRHYFHLFCFGDKLKSGPGIKQHHGLYEKKARQI